MKIYHIADRLTRWTMITLAVLMAVLAVQYQPY